MNREFCLEKAGMGVTQDEVVKLYNFLQGKPIETLCAFSNKLNLSEEEAYSIIYYLQEEMHLIPDHYERCGECGRIYDSDKEGMYSEASNRLLCDDCITESDY